MKKRLFKNGVMSNSEYKKNVNPRELFEIVDFNHSQKFRNKEFLHQEYIVEKKTCQEIADEICSSRTTVLKYLHYFSIPVREKTSIRNSMKTAYGKKIKNYELVDVRNELKSICDMKRLKESGFSYSKIAEILNTLEVKTKSGKAPWTGKSIYQILAKNNFSSQKLFK